MGYDLDCAFERYFDKLIGYTQKQKPVWVTKDGRKYYLEDLEDSHLLNCIGFVEKHKPNSKIYKPLIIEATKRGLLN